MWEPHVGYPDPAVQVLHPSFERYRIVLAAVERLATGFRFTEGPVWFGDHRCLLFSDIPNNRIMRWDEQSAAVSVFRSPSNFANGNARDREGRLVSCEHGMRRVTRTEHNGSITVLADSYEGKPLNSPNDVVVKSDGTIWFTDPAFGISSDYEGNRAEPELPTYLYRLDTRSGRLSVAADDLLSPNGLAFSPDEKRLYVVQSRATPYRNIVVYDVVDDGSRLNHQRALIDCGPGIPDGLRCDEDGNLWCGWGMGDPELDGVMVFSPQGERIGRIRLPERCANLCFGGRHRNRLFMSGSQSLYSLYVNTRGAL
ncbi:SMP-30/gluconolactonase/LRE family protein [Cupriavidus necator]|uniref:SMP-30/gluconolactonase/LRE family protein n=1 Tax=Cupriavidus necator TaxID=106590 RepID=UPI00339D956C